MPRSALLASTRERVPYGELEKLRPEEKAANKELTQLVAATGSTLMDLRGIGPLRRRPAAGRDR